LNKYKSISFPILAPVINDLEKTHWHTSVKECLLEIKTIFIDIDSVAFDNALNSKTAQNFTIKQSESDRSELDKKWTNLD